MAKIYIIRGEVMILVIKWSQILLEKSSSQFWTNRSKHEVIDAFSIRLYYEMSDFSYTSTKLSRWQRDTYGFKIYYSYPLASSCYVSLLCVNDFVFPYMNMCLFLLNHKNILCNKYRMFSYTFQNGCIWFKYIFYSYNIQK